VATVGDFELLRGSSTPLLATGDILRFVDVSDPTQAPQGSLVSATVANYFAAIPTPIVVTSASAAALAVGLTGATNPAFAVDASTALQVAGLKVTGAVTGGTVAVQVMDSGAAANLSLNAKGTGTIAIGSASTGRVTITPVTTITGALTIASTLTGGATSDIAINTNKFTVAASSGNTVIAGTLTLSAALTYGGVTLSNAVTGTGNMVLSAAPSLSGTVAFTKAGGQVWGAGLAATANSYAAFSNTGGSTVWGLESSAGGSIIPGSTAYDTVLSAGTSGGISLGTLSTLWARLTSTTFALGSIAITAGTYNGQTIGSAASLTGTILAASTITATGTAGNSGTAFKAIGRPSTNDSYLLLYRNDGTTQAGGLGADANNTYIFAGSSVAVTFTNATGAGAFAAGITATTGTLTAAAPTVAAGQVGFGATTASTVGAAGGASALPAAPLGYLIANVAGTAVKIPYYNN
jgi:hypothetical protein